MKSTRFWVLLLAGLLLLSGGTGLFLLRREPAGRVARITHEGELLYSIDLDRVEEPTTLTVEGAVQNVLRIEPGRICVESATCPDGLCVRQGWLESGVVPLVCLPNRLVIELVGGEADDGGLDAVVW